MREERVTFYDFLISQKKLVVLSESISFLQRKKRLVAAVIHAIAIYLFIVCRSPMLIKHTEIALENGIFL